MNAPGAAALLLLCAFIGAVSSLLNVLCVKGNLTDAGTWMFLFGGAFGGVIAMVCLMPPEAIGKQDIALIALTGYFFADVFATLMCGGARQAP